jgi:hypothetical protein
MSGCPTGLPYSGKSVAHAPYGVWVFGAGRCLKPVVEGTVPKDRGLVGQSDQGLPVG